MASKIRYHLDEHINHAIANGLRQRGIDVTATVDAKLRTKSDEAQMEFVRRERRVLVTCDAGFLSRHSVAEKHFGIIYYPPNSRSIGRIVSHLSLIYEVLTPEEMTNRVEYL